MESDAKKDQNVLSFITQMIQEKHGDDVSLDFLEVEKERLYIEFGEYLLETFEPMLNGSQKQQFSEIVENNSDPDQIQGFLFGSIENLEQKIIEALYEFKDNYLIQEN